MTLIEMARESAEEWRGILCHRDSEYEGDAVADLVQSFLSLARKVVEEAATVAERSDNLPICNYIAAEIRRMADQ